MHMQSIPQFRENKTQTLAEKLREQYKETLDLIIHHEWMIDLINSKLSLEQFETLITQEAYLYNQLAKHVLRLEINDSREQQEALTKVGVFFYSEASENLNILDKNYPLSCSTKNYSEEIHSIWEKESYPHKILTILVQLWIREGISELLRGDGNYSCHFKFWSERMANNSLHELVTSLSHFLNQSFTKDYGDDEEAYLYQEGFNELEHLLSRLLQFEISVRNHTYQISHQQLAQKDGNL